MTEIRIAGRVTSAFTHFAALGLAAILDAEGTRNAVFRWSDAEVPECLLSADASTDEIASAVLRHADRHTQSDSWIQARTSTGVAIFAARSKPESLRPWAAHFQNREDQWPESGWGALDDRMLGALGEPAWWRDLAGSSPDAGASRWEMKTRNKGQEFLADRLCLLASAVASRTAVDVLGGIVGESCVDEVGKDAEDSRTPTGLAAPGPADNALAWCALWGLSAVPVIRRREAVSHSAAMWPRGRTHPSRAVVPVSTSPLSVARWRSLVASQPFDRAAFAIDLDENPEDVAWLIAQGVRGVVRFSIDKRGSTSAPERVILSGEVQALWSVS